jgi:hypothetical protein
MRMAGLGRTDMSPQSAACERVPIRHWLHIVHKSFVETAIIPALRPAPGATGHSSCGKAAAMRSASALRAVDWRSTRLRGAGRWMRSRPVC